MVATVIDGKTMAKRLRADVKKRVTTLVADSGIIPGLAVISVGDDPASQIYVNSIGGRWWKTQERAAHPVRSP